VRTVDLKTKKTSTLNIRGLEPPVPNPAPDQAAAEGGPNSEEIKLASQTVRAESRGALVVQVELPAGYHLNPAAPQRYRVVVEDGQRQIGLESATEPGAIGHDVGVSQSLKNLQFPLRIPLRSHEAGKANLRLQLTLFYCREDNTGTCRIKTLVWRVPVEVTNNPSAPAEIKVQGKVTAE
jgi:hypothetical protein